MVFECLFSSLSCLLSWISHHLIINKQSHYHCQSIIDSESIYHQFTIRSSDVKQFFISLPSILYFFTIHLRSIHNNFYINSPPAHHIFIFNSSLVINSSPIISLSIHHYSIHHKTIESPQFITKHPFTFKSSVIINIILIYLDLLSIHHHIFVTHLFIIIHQIHHTVIISDESNIDSSLHHQSRNQLIIKYQFTISVIKHWLAIKVHLATIIRSPSVYHQITIIYPPGILLHFPINSSTRWFTIALLFIISAQAVLQFMGNASSILNWLAVINSLSINH